MRGAFSIGLGRYQLIGILALVGIVYVNLIRALVWDSALLVPLFTAILFVASMLAIRDWKQFRWPAVHVAIYCFLLLLMFAFITNNPTDRLYIDLFLYYVTPCIFFAFFALYRRAKAATMVVGVATLIFTIDVVFVVVELVDGFLGYDIHASRIITWYMEAEEGRFEHVYAGNANVHVELLDLIPPALGIRGWPNNTTPLYSASFVILLAYIYGARKGIWANWFARLAVFALGLIVLYSLGVKTHFVTVFVALLVITARLSRQVGVDLLIGMLGLTLFTLMTDFGSSRFENYMEQLFVGGHRFEKNQIYDEAGRLEVIFNFREYIALLQLSPFDLLAGAATFFQFLNSPFLFEQKILVYALILGVPYMALICLLMLLGIRDGFAVRANGSSQDKAVATGIACAILVLFLEMGHFGFTMNYPNYQFLYFLLATAAILKRQQRAVAMVRTATRDARHPAAA